MHTSYGDMDVAIPRDRKGEYEPRLIQKYQKHSYTGYGRKKLYPCMQKE